MRLLTRERGRIVLTEELIDDFHKIPPYAILSHTWSRNQDRDEVLYKDILEGTGKSKPGWLKVQYCCDKAAHDGIRYFWIDSCSIDRSSSAVLQEAIVSMYRWYQRAKVCYVYMEDVLTLEDFRRSRWFTRGWTLQELLAPQFLCFLDKDGQPIGQKFGEIFDLIASITGIDRKAFGPIFSPEQRSEWVEERFKWAESRTTTRPEDEAYCLMGIFGVHMPVIYGEGKDAAMKRLRKKVSKSLKEDRRDVRGSLLRLTNQPSIALDYDALFAVGHPFDHFPNDEDHSHLFL